MKTLKESDIRNIIRNVINEIRGSHVSHANFNNFSYDAFGSGEGKAPAHGYGCYVAIDPKGNPRYFLQSIRSDHFDNSGVAQSYYYDIEIPDDNGNNYLKEKYPINRIPNIIETIKTFLRKFGINIETYEDYSENMSCSAFLSLLGGICSNENFAQYRTVPNSPKSAASGILKKLGVVGMLYFSRTEGLCAVIFDPSQITIKQKTNLRDKLGDIQPNSDKDRKRVQKIFTNSDFYKERQNNFNDNPFDIDKHYSYEHYVDKDSDKQIKKNIQKHFR